MIRTWYPEGNRLTHSLEELREQMDRLCQRRRLRLQEAERIVQRANAEFDTQAVPLGRQIAELEKQLAPMAAKKSARVPNFEGLTEEEIEHYKELRKKSNTIRS